MTSDLANSVSNVDANNAQTRKTFLRQPLDSPNGDPCKMHVALAYLGATKIAKYTLPYFDTEVVGL